MGEEEKEIEEGDTRQRACSSAGGVARRRGASRVVAHGTPAVGAICDDADGRTDNGRDGSDGANGHTYNGRDCCSDDAAHNDGKCIPDDADSSAYGSFGNASDADGRTRSLSDADDGKPNGCSGLSSDSNARVQWVRDVSISDIRDVRMRTRGVLTCRAIVVYGFGPTFAARQSLFAGAGKDRPACPICGLL